MQNRKTVPSSLCVHVSCVTHREHILLQYCLLDNEYTSLSHYPVHKPNIKFGEPLATPLQWNPLSPRVTCASDSLTHVYMIPYLAHSCATHWDTYWLLYWQTETHAHCAGPRMPERKQIEQEIFKGEKLFAEFIIHVAAKVLWSHVRTCTILLDHCNLLIADPTTDPPSPQNDITRSVLVNKASRAT